MRDAAGQITDRLHLLRLAQRILDRLPFRYRLRHPGFERFIEVA